MSKDINEEKAQEALKPVDKVVTDTIKRVFPDSDKPENQRKMDSLHTAMEEAAKKAAEDPKFKTAPHDHKAQMVMDAIKKSPEVQDAIDQIAGGKAGSEKAAQAAMLLVNAETRLPAELRNPTPPAPTGKEPAPSPADKAPAPIDPEKKKEAFDKPIMNAIDKVLDQTAQNNGNLKLTRSVSGAFRGTNSFKDFNDGKNTLEKKVVDTADTLASTSQKFRDANPHDRAKMVMDVVAKDKEVQDALKKMNVKDPDKLFKDVRTSVETNFRDSKGVKDHIEGVAKAKEAEVTAAAKTVAPTDLEKAREALAPITGGIDDALDRRFKRNYKGPVVEDKNIIKDALMDAATSLATNPKTRNEFAAKGAAGKADMIVEKAKRDHPEIIDRAKHLSNGDPEAALGLAKRALEKGLKDTEVEKNLAALPAAKKDPINPAKVGEDVAKGINDALDNRAAGNRPTQEKKNALANAMRDAAKEAEQSPAFKAATTPEEQMKVVLDALQKSKLVQDAVKAVAGNNTAINLEVARPPEAKGPPGTVNPPVDAKPKWAKGDAAANAAAALTKEGGEIPGSQQMVKLTVTEAKGDVSSGLTVSNATKATDLAK